MPVLGVEVRPDRVRQAREDAGLSMARLAEGVVSKTTIHLIEAGRVRPSQRVLESIARRTHKPIEYFLVQGAAGSASRRQSSTPDRIFSANVNAAISQLREVMAGRQLTAAERIALESVIINFTIGRRVFRAIVDARQIGRRRATPD